MKASKILGIVCALSMNHSVSGQNLYDYYLVKGSSKIISMDYEGARYYLSKAVERYPDSADGWYHRGGANYFLLDMDAALIDFNRTLELDPTNLEVYKWRGMIYHQKLDYEKARSDYQAYLKFKPSDVFIELKLVELQIIEGNHKAAAKVLSALKELHEKNPHLHNTYGLLYEDQKLLVKSYEAYSTAIALDPTQAIFYMNRGRLLRAQDRLVEACTDWEQAAMLGLDSAQQLFQAANCHGPDGPSLPENPKDNK